jgi:2-polyprenyl-3-methyl-5-hydroxy-6-metoxy-1,4-benzoquinol methylase
MSHFNEVANEWDSPHKVKLIGLTGNKIKENVDLDNKLDILDFGCGTGLLAGEFIDHAKSIVGVDTSEGMLEVFDNKFSNFDNITRKNINLEDGKGLECKFDLIVSSMVFHHLNDPNKTLSILKEHLNENGKIAIVDLDKEDGTFHPDNKKMGVKHFGFAKDEIASWAEENGLKLEHRLVHHIEKNDRQYDLFLAVFS